MRLLYIHTNREQKGDKMKRFYAYDKAGDDMLDDCADLGELEAADLADAEKQAAAIWPGVSVRIVEA